MSSAFLSFVTTPRHLATITYNLFKELDFGSSEYHNELNLLQNSKIRALILLQRKKFSKNQLQTQRIEIFCVAAKNSLKFNSETMISFNV